MKAWPGNRLHRLLRAVERSPALDGPAGRLAGAVSTGLARPGARDLLTGTWLGHAVHPVLTDFADGAWMAGSFLDVFGPAGAAPAAQRMVGFGLLAALPTALTGLAEWCDSEGPRRRVGVVHAATSSSAFVLYGCSYLARRRRWRGAAVALGIVGGVIAILDGYVGGHLTLALGTGVDQTAFRPPVPDWTAAVALDDLADDTLTGIVAQGSEMVLVKRGAQVSAFAGRCTYRGAPLHEGQLQGDAVVCPRHGCTFALADGAVRRGPASLPLPTFETRVVDGRVEVRDPAGRGAVTAKRGRDQLAKL